jgi:hypothetical protein
MAGVGRLLVDPVLSAREQKISRRADWPSDPDLRQHGHAGLNKGEASNSVRRAVFFHRQGEIRDRPDQQARPPDNQIIGPSEKDHLEPAIGSRRVRASGNAAAQRAAIAQNPCAPKRSKIGPQASVRRAVAIPMPTVP